MTLITGGYPLLGSKTHCQTSYRCWNSSKSKNHNHQICSICFRTQTKKVRNHVRWRARGRKPKIFEKRCKLLNLNWIKNIIRIQVHYSRRKTKRRREKNLQLELNFPSFTNCCNLVTVKIHNTTHTAVYCSLKMTRSTFWSCSSVGMSSKICW